MKKFKILLFFVCYLSIPFVVKAQKIIQQEPYADKANEQIIIPYRIDDEGTSLKEYSIRLFYTQDGGASFVGPLQEVSSDIGDELIAGQKQIVWNYKTEDPTFNGKNVQFKIEADFIPLITTGPGNFLYSMAFPGWGSKKVRYQKKAKWRWLATGLTGFALIGGSIYFKSESNRNYDDYLNSRNFADAQASFDKASQQNFYANTAAIAAATIWVIDISRTIIKGRKNKKKKLRIEEKNNTNLEVKFYSDYDPYQNTSYFGLRFNF